jgi:acyl dehydratase
LSSERRPIDTTLAGFELEPRQWSWDERDVMLYALGVGASVSTDLPYVYEGFGPRVLPTFGVLGGNRFQQAMLAAIDIDLGALLHGEQSIKLHRPIPPRASAETTRRIVKVWDKGSAAVLEWESVTSDSDGPIVTTSSTSFIRGAGGFGGERGPSSATSRPSRPPDIETHERVSPDQSALYRLSGDRNPIHIDPDFARAAGFDAPFLHGLCTFGIAGRVLVQQLCEGRPERFNSFRARFSAIVAPGDELVVRLWRDRTAANVEVATADGTVVLTHGRCSIAAA